METRVKYETELIDKIKVIPDYLIPDLIRFIDFDVFMEEIKSKREIAP